MYEKSVAKEIAKGLGIEFLEHSSQEEILIHIADRVAKLLKADPDLLMSYLYRLDVEQKRIEFAIKHSPMPLNVTIAELIWQRQKQRIETKKKYKQDPIEGWEF